MNECQYNSSNKGHYAATLRYSL